MKKNIEICRGATSRGYITPAIRVLAAIPARRILDGSNFSAPEVTVEEDEWDN